jgi:hypothetical protein
MPRKLGRTSLVAAAALVAFGTFVIAASEAQASSISVGFPGRVSIGNGSYVGHQFEPVDRMQPNVNHPSVHPPIGHPHPGGTKQNIRIQ